MAAPIKMKVQEIEDWIIDSSPIFSLPDFRDMLRITTKGLYYNSFSVVIRRALKELDRKTPLFVSSQLYLTGEEFEFHDNLDACVAGELDWKYLQLPPTALVNISGSLLNAARTYQLDPGGSVIRYPSQSGMVTVEYLARHPYRFSKHPTEDKFTEDSVIYGVAIERDYWSDMFMNLVEYHLCNYLIELKTQTNYTELPIEVFSGLQDKRSELDNILNEYFLGPTHYSYLWR